ncbi:MAG: response regulator [Stigonema ocellatum SAG 48.90 = DSM 106950]|nr:response regulator [Stigonema ocellatum SAG 48.90 = DSM 106950]
MSHPELIGSNNLLDELKTCTQLQYSGKLDITSTKGHKWILYYRLGRIIWAAGGTHPLRRWYRQMAQYCPEIDVDKIQLRSEDIAVEYWDYRCLAILYKRQNIKGEQMKAIVENTIAELLFDITQQAYFATLSYTRNQQTILEVPISATGVDFCVKLMDDSWKAWLEAGLMNISPDLAPKLRFAEQLQQQVSASAYQNFLTLMTGKYSLRDLAVKMKQSLLPVVRSLQPYILKEIIELVELPDLPSRVTEVKHQPSTTKAIVETRPLVACVDDSPQVCRMLEGIFTPNGLRVIKIEDPMQALPILIEHKPDLIFLDLIMPIVNGYEICAQLRRVCVFANTPVIILTGSDGIFDKVRAKVVGCTDFITKPVEADKIMAMVHKYLRPPSRVKNISYLQPYVVSLSQI